jgi:hypothetical protein
MPKEHPLQVFLDDLARDEARKAAEEQERRAKEMRERQELEARTKAAWATVTRALPEAVSRANNVLVRNEHPYRFHFENLAAAKLGKLHIRDIDERSRWGCLMTYELAISFSNTNVVIEAKLVEPAQQPLSAAIAAAAGRHVTQVNFTALCMSDEALDSFLTDIYMDFSTPR